MSMLSRRDILAGAIVTGVALARSVTTAFASASQPSTAVNFAVPAEACDCHTHIFGNRELFPLAASRTYTPETASVAEMRLLHSALHIQRVVVVQPTVYGADNSCMLDTVKQLGPIARGVAVISDKTSNAELDQLHQSGIRGIRIHLDSGGQWSPAITRQRFKAATDRVKVRGWHVEIETRLPVIEALKDEVMTSAVPVSFDHFGRAQAALGPHQPGFGSLLSLVHSGKAYVDLSAPDSISNQAPHYADVTPLAKALIAANPRRVTWGSNWPHPPQTLSRTITEITPLSQIDDGHSLNQLATWVTGAAQLKLILVENPARLYGF